MTRKWTDWTEEELADEAQIGRRGQGAVVEAMRRLRISLIAQQRTTNRLTWVLVFFGGVQLLLLTFQILKQFWES